MISQKDYHNRYIYEKPNSNESWHTQLNLKMSICIVSLLHLIVLYIVCNGIPLTLMNVVWVSIGLRSIPI